MPLLWGKIGYWIYMPRFIEFRWTLSDIYRWLGEHPQVYYPSFPAVREYLRDVFQGSELRGAISRLRPETVIPEYLHSKYPFVQMTSDYLYTIRFTYFDPDQGKRVEGFLSTKTWAALSTEEVIEAAARIAGDYGPQVYEEPEEYEYWVGYSRERGRIE